MEEEKKLMLRDSTFRKSFIELFKDTEMCDVKMKITEDKTIGASSWMLSARSVYFKNLWVTGFKEGATREADLSQMPGGGTEEVWEYLLQYLYTGECELPATKKDRIFDLFLAADYLELLGLASGCVKYLQVQPPLLALRVLDQPGDTINFWNVKKAALRVLCLKFKEIPVEEWARVPLRVLRQILRCDDLQATELDVYRAVIEWWKANKKSDKTKRKLRQWLRLGCATAKEQFEMTELGELFTLEEQRDVRLMREDPALRKRIILGKELEWKRRLKVETNDSLKLMHTFNLASLAKEKEVCKTFVLGTRGFEAALRVEENTEERETEKGVFLGEVTPLTGPSDSWSVSLKNMVLCSGDARAKSVTTTFEDEELRPEGNGWGHPTFVDDFLKICPNEQEMVVVVVLSKHSVLQWNPEKQ